MLASLLAFGFMAVAGASKSCSAVEGMVIGADYIEHHASVADAGACCALCETNTRCLSYTYEHKGSTCYLKDNIGGNQTKSGRTSGIVSGRKPPPSPAPPAPGGLWGYACGPGKDHFPFCDTSLDIDARVKDLVSRISTEIAGAQLTARECPAMADLGVPSYYWGTNALHSIREVKCRDGRCPTAFPIPPHYGASFNMSLVKEMGQSFGTELRAYYNDQGHDSLDTWSPTINIVRDPRWGRNVEVPSEDPYLTGEYAKAYTMGAQYGPDAKIPMTAVTLKHWLAYSLENYGGVSRHTFDAKVSAYDIASTYYPGFEAPIRDAKALGVMCSYNMANGKPTCGNPELTKVLREDWGFDGYITSDTDACGDISNSHHYVKDKQHAVASCLAAGTDINSGSTYKGNLAAAVKANVTNRKEVEAALFNAFKLRFRLGLFDPKAKDANKDIPFSVVGSDAHKASSALASRQGMTLLKNNGNLLPFTPSKSIAVLGTDVDNIGATMGNYNADNICLHKSGTTNGIDTSCLTSIWDEIKAYNARATLVTKGNGKWDDAAIASAVKAAKAAEQVLIFVSNSETQGSEGRDVTTIALEKTQHAMVKAVLAARPDSALVMITGSIIGFDEVLASAPAILNIWMPGVYGGLATAQTIFGDNNPGGKLPVTVYYSNYTELSDFKDMSMTNGVGRTYRYLSQDFPVAFPFGLGLSYTTFDLSWASSAPVVFTSPKDSTKLTVEVSNTGKVDGDEVIMIYAKPPQKLATMMDETPIVQKQLIAFQRVHVPSGGKAEVSFDVSAKAFGLVDETGATKLHAGAYQILASKGHGKDLQVPVTIKLSSPALLKPFRKWWSEDPASSQSPALVV